MRSFFIILAFVAICGCRASYPYMDLRHPIYMVTDKSFWSGCDTDPAGEEACRKFRVAQINNGVDGWFEHFDEPTRPKAIVVSSQSELPRDVFNTVIYLWVKPNGCYDGEQHDACYSPKRGGKSGLPRITFEDPDDIYPSLIEHEFGHVLGIMNHTDPEKKVHSIMLPIVSEDDYVLPVDIDAVCKLHAECPPHENTWCEGGFVDENRCPSDSYEEGEANYKNDLCPSDAYLDGQINNESEMEACE